MTRVSGNVCVLGWGSWSRGVCSFRQNNSSRVVVANTHTHTHRSGGRKLPTLFIELCGSHEAALASHVPNAVNPEEWCTLRRPLPHPCFIPPLLTMTSGPTSTYNPSTLAETRRQQRQQQSSDSLPYNLCIHGRRCRYRMPHHSNERRRQRQSE